MSRSYKTPKGTELPLLNLRGKDYLEVKYRLVWFREDHPDWSIETEFMTVTDKSACAKATVKDETGKIIATSHKFENERGFPDFIEKAETGAIGRALALIGYGTQFCADELDEGDRIVDAPATPVARGLTTSVSTATESGGSGGPGAEGGDLGEFVVPFGRKYKGKRLKEIPRKEIESYVAWLEGDAEKKNTPLSYEVKVLKKAVELYYGGGAGAGSEEAQETEAS